MEREDTRGGGRGRLQAPVCYKTGIMAHGCLRGPKTKNPETFNGVRRRRLRFRDNNEIRARH